MNAEIAKNLLEKGDLTGAGAEIGLSRVTIEAGHAFDEDDDSYGRRLRAVLVGAEAAGAVSRPASNDLRIGFRPLGVKTVADAIEALQKFHPDTAVTSLVLSLLPTDSAPAEAAETKPVAPTATKPPALRTDGPTVEEWVMAGYNAESYPPSGYTARSSDDEIKAAIAAQKAARSHVQNEHGDSADKVEKGGVPGGEPAPDQASKHEAGHTLP